ncbi:MAG: ribbon-helix-helix protein, CopG family [Gemmatimonadota bacterium]
MKAIQITLDEALLRRLDATDEVRKEGRSAVVRRALAQYLKRQHAMHIRERYTRAYKAKDALGKEFSGWERQGTWPDE